MTGEPIKFKNKEQYEAHLAELRSKGLLKRERSRKSRPDVARGAYWKSAHAPMSTAPRRFERPKILKPPGHVRQTFSLIHPSWGRPSMCRQCIYRWMDLFSNHNDLEYILSLDTSNAREYLPVIRELVGKLNLRVVIHPNKTMVNALNRSARLATGEVLIYVSDDFECPPNYDIEIQKAVGKKEDWVLFVYDGMRKDIQTISILSRKYYERFGYIYYPKYKSMWADPDFTETAKRLNKVVDARNFLTFKHRHFTRGEARDATYARQNAPAAWSFGEKLFHQRAAENFGVK